MVRSRRSLSQLRAVAHNLTTLGGLHDENVAADWVQELVTNVELSDRTPLDVRAAVDLAVELHTYGVFAWVFFASATLQARLTRELALGLRFQELYDGRIPVERREHGKVIGTDVLAGDLLAIRWRLGPSGTHSRKDGWRLLVSRSTPGPGAVHQLAVVVTPGDLQVGPHTSYVSWPSGLVGT
jgi:hypothetical protein